TPCLVHAAGFDCRKAASADDALSKQDSELAALWKQVHSHSGDVGGTTTQLWVRGIPNTHAAIVTSGAHRDFHIDLLVFDEHQQVRMRYYTNVALDKGYLPRPIRDWHDRIDTTLPIDLMP
ncbi:MAG: hypothetical protein ABI870_03570, partial [Rhodanobacter sp.]